MHAFVDFLYSGVCIFILQLYCDVKKMDLLGRKDDIDGGWKL